tara:strand:+ start:5719 stop:6918 length:1200 start_codon:yes stop_codon:yes gene_type:complete
MKKVLILGASRYYSRSIEATRNAGYRVIAVDKNPEAEGFAYANESKVCDIADKELVLSVAKKGEIDAIIPLNDYGVTTAAYVCQAMDLLGISVQAAELATNKEKMRLKWMADGLPCPKVFVADSIKEIYDGVKAIGFPCILKPAHGCGGASRGVVVVNTCEELGSAIEFSTKFYDDKTTLVETFIESEKEHSAEVIVFNGKVHVLAIADKIKTKLPYRVDKNVIYPTSLPILQQKELVETIENSIASVGINIGAAHVELATTKNGPVLFELGARCGGGGTPEPIVPFVTGVRMFVELVRILAGDLPETLSPFLQRACNYHFLTPEKGKVLSISGLNTVRENAAVLDFEMFKNFGDEIGEVKIGTDRSGFIIVGAHSPAKAIEIGYSLENEIKIQYEKST